MEGLAALPGTVTLATALGVALAIDRVWGEPPAWAHPVVAMGRCLGALGPRLWALPAATARLGGALAWCFGAVLVLAVALVLDMGVAVLTAADAPLEQAALRGALLGVLLKPLLAWRMLRDEVSAVDQALSQSLDAGRTRLGWLVSRDTASLSEDEVRESAIESLAENLNDSVVAPLCWFLVAGLPGAALYRFANTADAMWGYRDHRRWMGQWAARADDALSWAPARLTALTLYLAAWRWPDWRALRVEAVRTPSPNGGWPMGAMALLLGVRLSKPGVYALHGSGRAPLPQDTLQALRWAGRAVVLTAAVLTMGYGLYEGYMHV
jgi:adenosylcobinamide-phosphate synthase